MEEIWYFDLIFLFFSSVRKTIERVFKMGVAGAADLDLDDL